MLSVSWVAGLLRRRGGRVGGAVIGVAVAVALLASLGSFLAASRATMTQRSVTRVAVDWQVQTAPGADPRAVLATTAAFGGVTAAQPVSIADTPGFTATVGGSTQTTGAGVVVGLPPGYSATFPGEVRPLVGAPDGVLLAQQTAANLHASPGDQIQVQRPGTAPTTLTVNGVVELPQADSLFQTVGAPAGSQPTAPPDNVLLVGDATWHQLFDPLAGARPDAIRTQVHVRLDRALPPDPASAYTQVLRDANNLEATLVGQGVVGDNLAATLGSARTDATYAGLLFGALGLPGAVLAGLLTVAIAGAGATRRRAEQGLLRTRGATAGQLGRLALAEAAVVAGLGAVLGLGAAAIIGQVAFGSPSFGATPGSGVVWSVGAALAGVVVAAIAVAVPAVRDARRLTVASARQAIGRGRRTPWWVRVALEAVAVVGAVAALRVATAKGYELVVAPEGVPTVSVDYRALLAPAFVWIAVALLTWRAVDLVLGPGRRLVTAAVRPLTGPMAGTVTAAMARQRRILTASTIIVALTVAFAASTSVFNATYANQAVVDARLTNGSDVLVSAPPTTGAAPGQAAQIAAVPGVASVEPLQHRFAYVGNDLQDIYGVNPATIGSATSLPNGYFSGGTAKDLIAKLAADPSGVLLSAETVTDFQLRLGDTVNLRLTDRATGAYRPIAFRFVGVVKEFPTAPKDSFIVANAGYLAAQSHSDAVGEFLVNAGGADPAALAGRVRALVGTSATVTDVTSTTRTIGSSLSSIGLGGLTKVELAFALVLAAGATGLLLALGMAERRRTFAIAGALGANGRQLGGMVWAEAGFVTGVGLVCGAVGGWVLSEVLVRVLTGVFDPPPDVLSVPWTYLVLVGVVGVSAVGVAGATAVARARRAPIAVLREL